MRGLIAAIVVHPKKHVANSDAFRISLSSLAQVRYGGNQLGKAT